MLNSISESNGNRQHMVEETTPAPSCSGNPLVSAIITTHNREPNMVLRAVNSVLGQTYQNIEVIVVDDSSPSFAQREEVERLVRSLSDDILYLKHEVCKGACAARNTGLSHAKGYYIGFLDDDDEWLPTKIEEQLKGFCDENTALVYGRIIFFDEKHNRRHIGNNRGKSGYIFEALIKNNYIGTTSNPLIKKECIETIGGFDVQMESSQDYELYLRLALRYPVQFIDAPLLIYHIHPGKRISTDTEKKIQGQEYLNLKYASYINKDNDTWYMRYRELIPFYQMQYGRSKALKLLISCIRRCPGRFLNNSKLLVRIILGNDLYMAIRDWLAAQYHLLKGDAYA